MQTTTRRPALLAGVIAASLLALSSVGVAAQDASTEPMAETAKVRVLHASPDAPAVDIYANGAEILSDVPFGGISAYLEVPAGEYQIQVFVAGPDPATERRGHRRHADLRGGHHDDRRRDQQRRHHRGPGHRRRPRAGRRHGPDPRRPLLG